MGLVLLSELPDCQLCCVSPSLNGQAAVLNRREGQEPQLGRSPFQVGTGLRQPAQCHEQTAAPWMGEGTPPDAPPGDTRREPTREMENVDLEQESEVMRQGGIASCCQRAGMDGIL